MRHFRLAAWIGMLLCAASDAAIVTTPAGLQPGDQYQLVFVTADTFDATSTDISTYNAEATAEAALDTDLAAFDAVNGVTWTVIGSTATANANVNAPSTGSVYTLDGTMVASPAQSLYSDQCPITAGVCSGVTGHDICPRHSQDNSLLVCQIDAGVEQLGVMREWDGDSPDIGIRYPSGKRRDFERPAKSAGRSSRLNAQGLRSETSPEKYG